MRFSVCVVAALAAGAVGFRVKPKGHKDIQGHKSKGEPGQVHGVFAMAAPGTAMPGLENPRGGPCFPGYRSWTERRQWYGTEADLATTITGVIGYRHPYLAGHALDAKSNKLREYPCDPPNTETPNIPRGFPVILHDWRMYTNLSQGFSDLLYNVSNAGIATSYTYDRDEAARQIGAVGWELIGSAVDEGGAGGLYVGRQVSHLLQQPDSKECILTFQGSSSFGDWVANLNIAPSHFCGFVGSSESCAQGSTDCVVDQAGESFVHSGFRDALREIVRNDDWQNDIRPKLSSCSKVYVTGHSLGGAQAELFAACAQKAPQPGEYGYEEDYKYIGWTV